MSTGPTACTVTAVEVDALVLSEPSEVHYVAQSQFFSNVNDHVWNSEIFSRVGTMDSN